MFSKSKPASGNGSSGPFVPANQGTFSVIGSDVTVVGNVTAKGDLHVDGRIEGDVTCASLVLGESGHVAGAIVADDARLSGEVNGSIDARTLTITKSARTTGDVSYESLSMEAGARADGRFIHKSADNGVLKLVATTAE